MTTARRRAREQQRGAGQQSREGGHERCHEVVAIDHVGAQHEKAPGILLSLVASSFALSRLPEPVHSGRHGGIVAPGERPHFAGAGRSQLLQLRPVESDRAAEGSELPFLVLLDRKYDFGGAVVLRRVLVPGVPPIRR